MDARSAIRRLVGGLLIAAGVLVSLTGGLCGGGRVIWAIGNWNAGRQWDTLLLSLTLGPLTIGVGIALFLVGRSLVRLNPAGRRAAEKPDP